MDTLLCRYSDMDYIMTLPPAEMISLLDKALEMREEERAWQMWLAKYPQMTKKNFIPFSQFYSKLVMPERVRPAHEILREAAEIKRKVSFKRG